MTDSTGLTEWLESLLGKEYHIRRNWWLFTDHEEPSRPKGDRSVWTVWPPFFGVRVELGGGEV